jgi:hypothetical protein
MKFKTESAEPARTNERTERLLAICVAMITLQWQAEPMRINPIAEIPLPNRLNERKDKELPNSPCVYADKLAPMRAKFLTLRLLPVDMKPATDISWPILHFPRMLMEDAARTNDLMETLLPHACAPRTDKLSPNRAKERVDKLLPQVLKLRYCTRLPIGRSREWTS